MSRASGEQGSQDDCPGSTLCPFPPCPCGAQVLTVDSTALTHPPGHLPALPGVPHLMLGAVLSQGEHLLTVAAGVLPPPGVYIAVPLQAGQGHVGTLTGRAHIQHMAAHHLHQVLWATSEAHCGGQG